MNLTTSLETGRWEDNLKTETRKPSFKVSNTKIRSQEVRKYL